MNKLWFDKSLSKAVDEPRVHTQLVGKRDEKLVPDDNVYTEKKYRLDSSIVKGLEKLGHKMKVALINTSLREGTENFDDIHMTTMRDFYNPCCLD